VRIDESQAACRKVEALSRRDPCHGSAIGIVLISSSRPAQTINRALPRRVQSIAIVALGDTDHALTVTAHLPIQ
jgi:hypothetical protein